MKIQAFQIGEQINLKIFKQFCNGKLLESSSSELFYEFDNNKFLLLLNCGVCCFCGYEDVEIINFLKVLQKDVINPIDQIKEVLDLEDKKNLGISELKDSDIVKIVMLNLAQSVALDHYNNIAEKALEQVTVYSLELETKGRVSISRKRMMKVIGKVLNTKNKIVENLFLFDSPDLVWEDSDLNRLNKKMVEYFDLRARIKEVEYTLKVVDDNLLIFREIYLHRESSKLEWIIIILIAFEIVKSFF